jgi:hypothetical protein
VFLAGYYAPYYYGYTTGGYGDYYSGRNSNIGSRRHLAWYITVFAIIVPIIVVLIVIVIIAYLCSDPHK